MKTHLEGNVFSQLNKFVNGVTFFHSDSSPNRLNYVYSYTGQCENNIDILVKAAWHTSRLALNTLILFLRDCLNSYT